MPKISEAEARALLSRPLYCECDVAWSPRKKQNAWRLTGGVVDEAGRGTHMFVQLDYTHLTKPPLTKFLFSVFIDNGFTTDRVYQLEVVQALRAPKDRHSHSHEHIGDQRVIGHALWQQWDYDEALAYFCAQTHIAFIPVPSRP
jgi:hypothetical protein